MLELELVCYKSSTWQRDVYREKIYDFDIGDKASVLIDNYGCYIRPKNETSPYCGAYSVSQISSYFCAKEEYDKKWSPAKNITLHFKNGEYLKLGDGHVMMEE